MNLSLAKEYIYNIRILSVNIKCICTSFRNRQNSELFRSVSQRVHMNFIFNDNVRILCLSCNVKKVGKLVRFKQKGQKQTSFLAFHKCCQGCLLRGPRYISTMFILVCALAVHSYRVTRGPLCPISCTCCYKKIDVALETASQKYIF